jgi:tetratricopeptide (TPR) repeat protein
MTARPRLRYLPLRAPRFTRAVAAGAIVAGALAGLLIWWFVHVPMSACEEEVRFGNPRRGVEICRARYAQRQDPRDLVWAARADLQLGKIDEAAQLAQDQLTGPRYGDAHAILSYIATRHGSASDARIHATSALIAHTFAGDERGRAGDFAALSQAAWKVGDFTAALEAADEALRLARRLGDPAREHAAHLARADALRRMGDGDGAARALLIAIERATRPCDKAWAHLKSGLCQMEAQQEGLALSELAEATKANQECGSSEVTEAVGLNEAMLLRWTDPAGALARLDAITKVKGEMVETLLMRGYLAADRGALDEADGYFVRAEGMDEPDADWLWEVARARAELAELRGTLSDDLHAEAHYRRAIGMIAALRTTARARSAYLVASHRGPYDELIALLARRGRWRDVLAVVLELDASDMLRATADAGAVRVHGALNLGPSLPSPAPPSSADVEAVLAAWRSRDLVVVIAPAQRQIAPGHERAYRLQITGGQVTGEDVGEARLARTSAADLFANPENPDAARALGRTFVPAGASSRTLHVLAIGALGKVPLAALRDDAGLVSIGRRPLVRVLGLRANSPESRGTGPAMVISDPRGDLPSAAAEGAVVTAALGPGVLVSGSSTLIPATRDRLWAAQDAQLLHIAGHVLQRERWRVLPLADGEVSPAEMVQRRLAPRIAVLAGCGSAAALDDEGWGSIAAALLESGTAVVIATDRSVDADATLVLMRIFYAQRDWRTDPARALARVQQALAARGVTAGDPSTQASLWAAFAVLARPPVVGVHSAQP